MTVTPRYTGSEVNPARQTVRPTGQMPNGTGPVRGGMGFQDTLLPTNPISPNSQIQQQLADLVKGLPLPVDTSGIIQGQQDLQAQINSMYAMAKQAQAAGYASQIDLQAQINAMLGRDPTAPIDQQILDALELQRQQTLRPRNPRMMWAYGFQRNG